jgi:hypothetical protein
MARLQLGLQSVGRSSRHLGRQLSITYFLARNAKPDACKEFGGGIEKLQNRVKNIHTCYRLQSCSNTSLPGRLLHARTPEPRGP